MLTIFFFVFLVQNVQMAAILRRYRLQCFISIGIPSFIPRKFKNNYRKIQCKISIHSSFLFHLLSVASPILKVKELQTVFVLNKKIAFVIIACIAFYNRNKKKEEKKNELKKKFKYTLQTVGLIMRKHDSTDRFSYHLKHLIIVDRGGSITFFFC